MKHMPEWVTAFTPFQPDNVDPLNVLKRKIVTDLSTVSVHFNFLCVTCLKADLFRLAIKVCLWSEGVTSWMLIFQSLTCHSSITDATVRNGMAQISDKSPRGCSRPLHESGIPVHFGHVCYKMRHFSLEILFVCPLKKPLHHAVWVDTISWRQFYLFSLHNGISWLFFFFSLVFKCFLMCLPASVSETQRSPTICSGLLFSAAQICQLVSSAATHESF